MSAAATPSPLTAKLAKLGLHREFDLILHLPLRYEDETHITAIAQARPGVPAQFEVEVVDTEIAFRPRRQLLCRVRDDTGTLLVRLINFYPSQQKQFAPGARLRLFGDVRAGYFGPELVHPRASNAATQPLPQALTPVYPTTAGLSQAVLRKLTVRALSSLDLTDTLPESLRLRLGLAGFGESVRRLHQPQAAAAEDLIKEQGAAWRRIRFDELLAQQLSLRQAYAVRRARDAPILGPLHTSSGLTDRLLTRLCFRLTDAQERAWAEIETDLGQPHPMQRLLQGDVGSGKTIVAVLALLRAVDNGWQGALMAPTEILAEQHWNKLKHWLTPLDVPLAWISSSLKKTQKTAMQTALREGKAMIAVGTHALIEEEIAFARLGLAVVDEQHRFGVRQRLALRQKGVNPHQLMLSATPIPRTLAMSFYADLDVSVIDELPPGRRPILTKLVSETRRDEVVSRVRAACAVGRQAYWVCPLIEESETQELQAVLATFERLREELPELSIGLVHGRLKTIEKSQIMEAFVAGSVQVLVATTVIEVGVDVANASLMVVEHAERFGLAQLHQLRGRVGRGAADSACVLLYVQPLSETARQRLKIIYEFSDGFEIARADLALRGPGEFIGARQSGLPLLRYADLDDVALVEAARAAAEELLREHPQAVQAHLDRWLSGCADLLKA